MPSFTDWNKFTNLNNFAQLFKDFSTNSFAQHFSELFNLPVPALWTAVLGEWDRAEQKGAYVPIEKIVLHHRFYNYQHDIGKKEFVCGYL